MSESLRIYQPKTDPLHAHRVESYRVEHLTRSEELIRDLDGVTGGSISLNANAVLRGSGQLELVEQQQNINLVRDRVRIWWEVDGVDPWPLGVYLLDSPTVKHDDTGSSREIQLIDKLAIIQDDRVEKPYSVPAGTNITGEVKALIESTGERNIALTEDSTVLNSMMVWEAGESKLRIINDLLEVINYWSLFTDGMGSYRVEPYVRPENRPVAYSFIEGEQAIHTPDWEDEQDFSEVPNKVVLVSQPAEEEEPLIATAMDTNPASPTSFPNRGRWVTYTDNGIEAANQEQLQGLADRKLLDLTDPVQKLSISHAPVPLWYNNAVRFTSQGKNTLATVTSFTYSLSPGELVQAEWRQIA